MRPPPMPTGADSAEGDGAGGDAPPSAHRPRRYHLDDAAKKLNELALRQK